MREIKDIDPCHKNIEVFVNNEWIWTCSFIAITMSTDVTKCSRKVKGHFFVFVFGTRILWYPHFTLRLSLKCRYALLALYIYQWNIVLFPTQLIITSEQFLAQKPISWYYRYLHIILCSEMHYFIFSNLLLLLYDTSMWMKWNILISSIAVSTWIY